MKTSYIIKGFQKTVSERFPKDAKKLNAALFKRLDVLRGENAGAAKEKQLHLERQILPGIAVYELLQTVMPKDEAFRTVHGYVEHRAQKAHKAFSVLLRIPGLYKKVPEIFAKQTKKHFGTAAGFSARERQNARITIFVPNTDARSCAAVSATVTIFPIAAYIPSFAGTESKHSDAGTRCAIFACK